MIKHKARHFFIYVALFVLLCSIIILMGCTDNQTDENNQNNQDSSSAYISAMDAYEQVKSDIQNWDSNFRIARIHHFGTSEYRVDAKESSWEFYVESGDEEKSTDFTYTVGSGVTKSTDASYGTGSYTCSSEDIKIDSTEATATALNAIKSEFYPDFDGGCKAELDVYENGGPYWKITANNRRKNGHIDLDKESNYGYAEVDAITGELLSVDSD